MPRPSPIALGGVCKIGAESLQSLISFNNGFTKLQHQLGEGRTTGYAAYEVGAILRLSVPKPLSMLGTGESRLPKAIYCLATKTIFAT